MGMVDRGRIEALLREHYERWPLMRATDFYKLLYQGAFGVGHIMGDAAWFRLEKEAGSVDLDEHPGEPLVEDVSADGSMVRVNLRPYLRRGLPLEDLFEAMKKTAPQEGPNESFLEAWGVYKGLAASCEVQVNTGELEALDEELQREGPSPHHHSDAYREEYHPAYRIVRREFLEGLIE
ncbi:MAG: hypothetical protein NWF12_05520 [Candidatus Bathyarchaeota archaeon]|nr:hypothetical protein [Candidatus Bathyarchaeota archaeon]